jgi:DNA recombination protein RmuC
MDAVSILIGIACGAAVVLLVLLVRRRPDADLARRLAEETYARQAVELDRIIAQLRDTFGSLSKDALKQNTEQFLQLADTRLESQTRTAAQVLEEKKKLIDATLQQVATKIGEVHNTVQRADTERKASHERLVDRLGEAAKATDRLQATTGQLREALASPARRGQWGERMAADVLRLAGFVENVNYRKQATVESGQRPDYTFFLPNDLVVNMDVKFPLDNYLKYLDAAEDAAAASARDAFLRDVRGSIKAVGTREYIDPAGGTVDYVLLFIPNEQIYGFIHESDSTLIDDAIKKKVVFCSPLTLYAILAVIRQAVENFRLEEASDEILALLGSFRNEWDKYGDVVGTLGRRLEQVMKAYAELTTTRTRQLERSLDKIDDLRQRRGVALPEEGQSGNS